VQPATLQIVLVGEPGVGCSAFIERWVTNQFRGESSSSASSSSSSPSTTAPPSAFVGGVNSGVSHKVASEGLEDVACRGSCGQLRSQGETLLVLCWDVGSSDVVHNKTGNAGVVLSGADAVVVLYDVTRRSTFEAVRNWVRIARCRCRSPLVPLALVGTKADLLPPLGTTTTTDTTASPPGSHRAPKTAAASGGSPDNLAGVAAELAPQVQEAQHVGAAEAEGLANSLGALHFRTSAWTGAMVSEAVVRLVGDALTFVRFSPSRAQGTLADEVGKEEEGGGAQVRLDSYPKRLVIESPWLQFASEYSRFGHPPRVNHWPFWSVMRCSGRCHRVSGIHRWPRRPISTALPTQ
jgi:hypothetical protein